MPVAKKIADRPVDRLQRAACRRPDMEPNWWTDTHETMSHDDCRHGLARHVCLAHCPVLAECAEDEVQWDTDWKGMVVAGTLRSLRYGVAVQSRTQPFLRGLCPFCVKEGKV